MGVGNLNPPGCMECLQCGKINPALTGIMNDSGFGGNRMGGDQWSCPVRPRLPASPPPPLHRRFAPIIASQKIAIPRRIPERFQRLFFSSDSRS